jgi:hypothetical protein
MTRYYDKDKFKEALELEQIFDLVELWGGEPEYTSGGLVAHTICHNLPGEGSKKLYYYENSRLFKCYTGCFDESTFDIFQLCIKVAHNQKNAEWELYDAMDYIAQYFGMQNVQRNSESNESELADWDIFRKHQYSSNNLKEKIQLKEYDSSILTRFSYPRIIEWEHEGIKSDILSKNFIGYYAGNNQITIPHFDINMRLIGIRGRTLVKEDGERYGKYRPLTVNRQLYSHPLSMNLYNLNNSKDNIKQLKTAIIFESEKATMQYSSFYGPENDISVACCGSSVSTYQIDLLRQLGIQEVIFAFDRDFVEIGDEKFLALKSRLIKLYNKYHNFFNVTAIFDKEMILPLKASPTDAGPQVFEKLLKERIIPKE